MLSYSQPATPLQRPGPAQPPQPPPQQASHPPQAGQPQHAHQPQQHPLPAAGGGGGRAYMPASFSMPTTPQFSHTGLVGPSPSPPQQPPHPQQHPQQSPHPEAAALAQLKSAMQNEAGRLGQLQQHVQQVAMAAAGGVGQAQKPLVSASNLPPRPATGPFAQQQQQQSQVGGTMPPKHPQSSPAASPTHVPLGGGPPLPSQRMPLAPVSLQQQAAPLPTQTASSFPTSIPTAMFPNSTTGGGGGGPAAYFVPPPPPPPAAQPVVAAAPSSNPPASAASAAIAPIPPLLGGGFPASPERGPIVNLNNSFESVASPNNDHSAGGGVTSPSSGHTNANGNANGSTNGHGNTIPATSALAASGASPRAHVKQLLSSPRLSVEGGADSSSPLMSPAASPMRSDGGRLSAAASPNSSTSGTRPRGMTHPHPYHHQRQRSSLDLDLAALSVAEKDALIAEQQAQLDEAGQIGLQIQAQLEESEEKVQELQQQVDRLRAAAASKLQGSGTGGNGVGGAASVSDVEMQLLHHRLERFAALVRVELAEAGENIVGDLTTVTAEQTSAFANNIAHELNGGSPSQLQQFGGGEQDLRTFQAWLRRLKRGVREAEARAASQADEVASQVSSLRAQLTTKTAQANKWTTLNEENARLQESNSALEIQLLELQAKLRITAAQAATTGQVSLQHLEELREDFAAQRARDRATEAQKCRALQEDVVKLRKNNQQLSKQLKQLQQQQGGHHPRVPFADERDDDTEEIADASGAREYTIQLTKPGMSSMSLADDLATSASREASPRPTSSSATSKSPRTTRSKPNSPSSRARAADTIAHATGGNQAMESDPTNGAASAAAAGAPGGPASSTEAGSSEAEQTATTDAAGDSSTALSVIPSGSSGNDGEFADSAFHFDVHSDQQLSAGLSSVLASLHASLREAAQASQHHFATEQAHQVVRSDWHNDEQRWQLERMSARHYEDTVAQERMEGLKREREWQQQVLEGRAAQALVEELRQQLREVREQKESHTLALGETLRDLAQRLEERDQELEQLRGIVGAATAQQPSTADPSRRGSTTAVASSSFPPSSPAAPRSRRAPQQSSHDPHVLNAPALDDADSIAARHHFQRPSAAAAAAAGASSSSSIPLSAEAHALLSSLPERVSDAVIRAQQQQQPPAGISASATAAALAAASSASTGNRDVLRAVVRSSRCTRWLLVGLFVLQSLFVALWFVLTSGAGVGPTLVQHPFVQLLLRTFLGEEDWRTVLEQRIAS